MSSRQLKKLERAKLEASNNEEPDIEEPVVLNQNKGFNAFSFLGDGNEEEEEQEDKEEEVVEEVKTPKKPSSKKKKKKAKQPKKDEEDSEDELDKILAEAKAKDQEKLGSVEPIEDDLEGVADFEEEYNEITQPMISYDSNFKNFTTERLSKCLALLSIDNVKNLDPDEELKNLFGELSLETIEDANTTTALSITPDVLKQFKRLARLTKGWGGKDRRSVPGSNRKLLLTRIKDDYLPTTIKPLQMEELDDDSVLDIFDYKEDIAEVEELQLKIRKEKKLGVKYFKFNKVHSVRDRVADSQFYASVVLAPDHDALFALLNNHPYHVETLLQVSMVLLRQGDQKSTSNALIEKCLFVFDRCFHMFFHDTLAEAKNGLLRLPYESFMNRQFQLCIFRYIIGLAERATFFTSFNYCKLLLSINPTEDPLGVRYFIDFYAIMSGEYKYLTQLADSPLVTSYTKWFTPGIAFSTALAYIHLNDMENAKKALKRAHLSHPYTSYRLLETICISPQMPIKESDVKVNEEIILSAETYMVRAKLLWNDSEKIKFLTDELMKYFIEDGVSATTPSSFSSMVSKFFKGDTKPKDNKEIPFNLLRFVILSGENSLMAKVPQNIWSRDDIYEFDPLPPKVTTLGYDARTGIENNKVVDYALDYVNQDILATLIQNRTQTDEFDDIVRQIQQQE
ncbi:ribosome quality control complex subunit 1 [[Candida] jaroonii]|uniref:Ribosome quality control complex subunit 1 n=1 Tax=[Candida] jaroonii TaxID=467808 RepID=A0ACA9Y4G1_9ASCO|nr:ribosome quality control complex subunit 1 [[Candida] jaroonii]